MIELRQTDLATDEDRSYGIDTWAKFFKATTWEEIKMITKENPSMNSTAESIYLSNSDFAISDLCYELAMSRSSVYNKIKTLTGKGPNDIIRILRLSRAKEMLSRRPYPIAEVSAKVGFSDPKYFSTCFKKEFGVSPSRISDIL